MIFCTAVWVGVPSALEHEQHLVALDQLSDLPTVLDGL